MGRAYHKNTKDFEEFLRGGIQRVLNELTYWNTVNHSSEPSKVKAVVKLGKFSLMELPQI